MVGAIKKRIIVLLQYKVLMQLVILNTLNNS